MKTKNCDACGTEHEAGTGCPMCRAEELAGPAGSVTLTYEQFKDVLQKCRWQVESAPGEPPDGYEGAEEETIRVADACWHSGMDQLSTAVLNWAYDTLKSLNNPDGPHVGPATGSERKTI